MPSQQDDGEGSHDVLSLAPQHRRLGSPAAAAFRARLDVEPDAGVRVELITALNTFKIYVALEAKAVAAPATARGPPQANAKAA